MMLRFERLYMWIITKEHKVFPASLSSRERNRGRNRIICLVLVDPSITLLLSECHEMTLFKSLKRLTHKDMSDIFFLFYRHVTKKCVSTRSALFVILYGKNILSRSPSLLNCRLCVRKCRTATGVFFYWHMAIMPALRIFGLTSMAESISSLLQRNEPAVSHQCVWLACFGEHILKF